MMVFAVVLAQCPCSGGGSSGGGGRVGLFLALTLVVGLFALVKCIGYVWGRKGVSVVNKVTKIGIVVALLAAVGVVIAMKADKGDGGANQTATRPAIGPSDSVPEGELPRLVDLGADRCIPCKMMAPILEELKIEYVGRLGVEFLDVWKKPSIGKEYSIRMIPTQIFYDASGKELYRHEGFISKEDILAKWKALGVDLSSKAVDRNKDTKQ